MPRGDLRDCLNEADAFYEVGKAYAGADKMLPPSRFVYPVIVNLAFSCELYFKALMIWRNPDGMFEKGHSLVKLFGKLDEVDRGRIKELYVPDFYNWVFDDAIEEFDIAFESWRYAFECDKDDLTITIFELIRFADAVHTYVSGLISSSRCNGLGLLAKC